MLTPVRHLAEAPAMLVLLLLYAGLVGGGNDLLDYASTDAYWKARDVPVTVDAMRAELRPADPAVVAGLVRDLGSADRAVRDRAADRLLAAGAEALPALQ